MKTNLLRKAKQPKKTKTLSRISMENHISMDKMHSQQILSILNNIRIPTEIFHRKNRQDLQSHPWYLELFPLYYHAQ